MKNILTVALLFFFAISICEVKAEVPIGFKQTEIKVSTKLDTNITRTIITYAGVKYGVYKKQNTLHVTFIDQNNKETMLDYINADLATYYFKLIEDKNLMKPISRTEMMDIISNISKQHPFFRD